MADSAMPRLVAGRACIAGAVLLLGGCGVAPERDDGPPARAGNFPHPADAVPRPEPKSRYGNPPSYVVFGKRYHTLPSSHGYVERGIASWYGSKFHGRRTSNGETFDMYRMTAAHRSLPLPTYVAVRNLANRREIVVRVNDRGPFHGDRIIDLSYAAARKLGIVANGTGMVEVRAIDPTRPIPRPAPPPAPAPESAPDPRLYVQVGAFTVRENAETLLRRLGPVVDRRGEITEAVVDGRRLFRVRVGPLADVATADVLADTVRTRGLGDPHIVID